MDIQQIAELKKLVNAVVSAHTIEEATPRLNGLKFKVQNLQRELDYWSYTALQKVVDLADSALGQKRNKEHWLTQMWQAWYLFENNATRGHQSSAVLVK